LFLLRPLIFFHYDNNPLIRPLRVCKTHQVRFSASRRFPQENQRYRRNNTKFGSGSVSHAPSSSRAAFGFQCRDVFCCVLLCCDVLCWVPLCRVVLCCVFFYPILLRSPVFFCALLYSAIPYSILLCFVVLCYALCCPLLYSALLLL
jgi:hypothetical protein